MVNTYTKILLHLVFSVQNRDCIIADSWKDELYRYITGIVVKNQHKLLIINGMPDHIHMLIGMRPSQSLSELMQDIKGNSSRWINEKGYIRGKFSWQEGYGAFSSSTNEISTLIGYIKNQAERHKQRTFSEEYLEMLNVFEIGYDERFVFKPIKS